MIKLAIKICIIDTLCKIANSKFFIFKNYQKVLTRVQDKVHDEKFDYFAKCINDTGLKSVKCKIDGRKYKLSILERKNTHNYD